MAQQARAIQTRQSILLAAATVFDERGYGSATISEILARAGVTKGLSTSTSPRRRSWPSE